MTQTTNPAELLDKLPADEREKLRECQLPQWTSPMLATLTDERFSDDQWIYERKLDGERCLAWRDGKQVRLKSRNKKRLDDTYPGIVAALEQQSATRFLVDGEIVAFEEFLAPAAADADQAGGNRATIGRRGLLLHF